MKLGALTLGAYRLIIIISFWSISPFIKGKNNDLGSISKILENNFFRKRQLKRKKPKSFIV
jgi:hypothetical protein